MAAGSECRGADPVKIHRLRPTPWICMKQMMYFESFRLGIVADIDD